MDIVHIIKERYGHFSEEELSDIQRVMEVKKLKRQEIFAPIGHKAPLGFVLTGSLYSRTIDAMGNEKISDVFYPKEKHFVFDYESYLLDKPMSVEICAHEPSTIVVGNVQTIKKLYEKHPRFYQLEMIIVQQNFLLAIHRIKILQQNDPSVGLQLLRTHFPSIFSHFSFSQIASFLGIHRNTLTTALKKTGI